MKDFISHLNQKDTSFQCFDANDGSEQLVFTVKVHHLLGKPATEKQIEALKAIIPDNQEIIDLYQLHNGMTLYRHVETARKNYSNGDASGITFYPIYQLKKHNKEWKSYNIDVLHEEYMFDFQKYGVTFGEVTYSMNSFVLYEGKVYYDDHDGGDDTPIGENIEDFLSKIIADPAQFLYDRGCHTRYSDSNTETQWIPKVFNIEQ